MILASRSQGERGQNGKKKIYEIVVDGNRVIVRWGKAEEDTRQTQTKWFQSEWEAKSFATNKKWEKIDKGYELVLVA
jgi:predicted DNA-binding WGR domain protein